MQHAGGQAPDLTNNPRRAHRFLEAVAALWHRWPQARRRGTPKSPPKLIGHICLISLNSCLHFIRLLGDYGLFIHFYNHFFIRLGCYQPVGGSILMLIGLHSARAYRLDHGRVKIECMCVCVCVCLCGVSLCVCVSVWVNGIAERVLSNYLMGLANIMGQRTVVARDQCNRLN